MRKELKRVLTRPITLWLEDEGKKQATGLSTLIQVADATAKL
jgi:hypothetical protein